MTHDDIRHKLSEYLDGAVTDKEKAEIEAHLKLCIKCSEALEELRKAVQHVKELEEVESPAWLTQKIMAKVREEAEKKRGILDVLFHPLHVKLPIQAVAAVFLVVTAFYIYQTISPQTKVAEAPRGDVAAKQEASAPVTEEKGAPSSVIARSKALKQSQGPAPAPAKATPQTKPPAEFEDRAERFTTAPRAAAPADERTVKEHEAVAAAKRRDEAKPLAGFMATEEARPPAPAPAAKTKTSAMAEKEEAGITLTVSVKDLESAGKDIEKTIARLNGKILSTDSTENKRVFVARLRADKLWELYDGLKRIGELRSKKTRLLKAKGEIEIRIESVRTK